MSTNKILLANYHGICEITLNNPTKLFYQLILLLQELFNNLKKQKIKVILLKSTGPSFCSGHDPKEVKAFQNQKNY